MKKIGIVGYGYVGKAIAKLLENHYNIEIYDSSYCNGAYSEIKKVCTVRENLEELQECELIIICVPTPMKENGSCDISIVRETIAGLDNDLILIKSTIPPGTTKMFCDIFGKKIAFSPEFIGESKYFIPYWKYPHPTDMKYHDFMIIGGEKETTSQIAEIFKPVIGVCAKIVQTDSATAELDKYLENSWGAMKVTFANEFYEIAKVFDVDYDELRELWLLDSRTERMHTAVFKEKRGFGGKCFPKDVHGIVRASEDAGYEPKLIKEVLNSNNRFQDE